MGVPAGLILAQLVFVAVGSIIALLGLVDPFTAPERLKPLVELTLVWVLFWGVPSWVNRRASPAGPAASGQAAEGRKINATLFFYGETELAGHLPIYGTMLVLLVYGSDPDLRRDVMSLWPFRSGLRYVPART